jgi:hypothetical protein
VDWEAGIVPFPCEPLFLRAGDDLTVNHQGGGTVMIERRYT